MGKSSSGKDTVYKKIMQNKEMNLKKIVPYTTRPIREGEKEGVQYHFTDLEGFNKLVEDGKVIEYRVYNTFHGEWRYFTVSEGIDLDNNNYLIIGTPESYKATKEYFGNDKVLPILIDVDDGIRLQRALNRELKQQIPKYEESYWMRLLQFQMFWIGLKDSQLRGKGQRPCSWGNLNQGK